MKYSKKAGWQTSSFVAGELKSPQRDLPRGLLIGVSGVVVLYMLVNYVFIRALGMGGLDGTTTPASDVMRAALGEQGATLIATGIAVSTIGFLSQNLLTGPRVYFAMATDGTFFKSVARVHPRTRVPVVAHRAAGRHCVPAGALRQLRTHPRVRRGHRLGVLRSYGAGARRTAASARQPFKPKAVS